MKYENEKPYYQIIKELRIDRDEPQKQVAAMLGIDQSYYAKYENGVYNLPIQHFKKICEHFQVSADYILGLPKGLAHGTRKVKLRMIIAAEERIYDKVEDIINWATEQGHISDTGRNILLQNIEASKEEE